MPRRINGLIVVGQSGRGPPTVQAPPVSLGTKRRFSLISSLRFGNQPTRVILFAKRGSIDVLGLICDLRSRSYSTRGEFSDPLLFLYPSVTLEPFQVAIPTPTQLATSLCAAPFKWARISLENWNDDIHGFPLICFAYVLLELLTFNVCLAVNAELFVSRKSHDHSPIAKRTMARPAVLSRQTCISGP